MTNIWFDNVTKKDAGLLVKWWNANTKEYYFRKKQDRGRFWQVIRQHN